MSSDESSDGFGGISNTPDPKKVKKTLISPSSSSSSKSSVSYKTKRTKQHLSVSKAKRRKFESSSSADTIYSSTLRHRNTSSNSKSSPFSVKKLKKVTFSPITKLLMFPRQYQVPEESHPKVLFQKLIDEQNNKLKDDEDINNQADNRNEILPKTSVTNDSDTIIEISSSSSSSKSSVNNEAKRTKQHLSVSKAKRRTYESSSSADTIHSSTFWHRNTSSNSKSSPFVAKKQKKINFSPIKPFYIAPRRPGDIFFGNVSENEECSKFQQLLDSMKQTDEQDNELKDDKDISNQADSRNVSPAKSSATNDIKELVELFSSLSSSPEQEQTDDKDINDHADNRNNILPKTSVIDDSDTIIEISSSASSTPEQKRTGSQNIVKRPEQSITKKGLKEVQKESRLLKIKREPLKKKTNESTRSNNKKDIFPQYYPLGWMAIHNVGRKVLKEVLHSKPAIVSPKEPDFRTYGEWKRMRKEGLLLDTPPPQNKEDIYLVPPEIKGPRKRTPRIYKKFPTSRKKKYTVGTKKGVKSKILSEEDKKEENEQLREDSIVNEAPQNLSDDFTHLINHPNVTLRRDDLSRSTSQKERFSYFDNNYSSRVETSSAKVKPSSSVNATDKTSGTSNRFKPRVKIISDIEFEDSTKIYIPREMLEEFKKKPKKYS